MDQQKHEKLLELLERVCNDTIDEAGCTKLQTLLEGDPEAQDLYIDYAFVNVGIAHWSNPTTQNPRDQKTATPASPSSFILPPSSFLSRTLKHECVLAIAAGVTFIAALLGWAAMTYLPEVAEEKEKQPAVEQSAEKHVAILNGEREVKWIEGERTKAHDPRLWPGEKLVIQSGLIELKYLTGARVVIKGPAEFEVGSERVGGDGAGELGGRPRQKPDASISLDSHNSGFLKQGSLVARCDTKASEGFAIYTPYARVVDLGTEFGVDVDDKGSARVAVLSGNVELIRGSGEEIGQRVKLAKGQFASVAADESQIDVGSVGGAQHVAEYREMLEADFTPTDLMVYYRADNVDGQGNPGDATTTRLVNLASPGTHDGTIVDGTGIVRNSEQANTPFEYGVALSGEDQTHIAANSFQIAGGVDKVTNATWEFWLRADSGVMDGRGALYGEFPAESAIHETRHYARLEEIGANSGLIRFDEFEPSGNSTESDSRLFNTKVFTQIVFTKHGDMLTFYKNGVQLGATKSHSETYGGGVVEQTLFGKRPSQNESFDGQFSMIRVYDRALSPAQVSANYRAEMEKNTNADNADRKPALLD